MVTSTTTRLSGVAGALAIKAPVRAATTANITLAALQTVDGVALADADRVLVKGQVTATENGIYAVSSGNWSRTKDFNSARDVVTGTRVLVNEGDTNRLTEWIVTSSGSILPGTSSITFQVTGLGPLALFANGIEAAPGLASASDPGSGIYRIGPDNLGMSIGGAKVLDLSATGLDVTGTLDASGATALASTLSVTGTSTLTGVVTHASTSHAAIAGGTTAERPVTPAQKHIRFNTSTGFFEYYNGTDWIEVVKWHNPRGFIDGLTLSNGADTDHDIDITGGSCRNSANVTDIDLSPMTKQFDAAWAAGTGAGGLSSSLVQPGTGLAANTWYHVFAILVGGIADVGADTSVSAANLVADHSATAYRRIGSFLTDGSANIHPFIQDGDDFTWSDPNSFQAIDGPLTSTTAALVKMSVPPDLKIKAHLSVTVDGAGSFVIYFNDPDAPSLVPSISNGRATIAALNGVRSGSTFTVFTDTSSQVRWVATTNARSTTVSTLGWTDPRGKDNP